MIALALVVASVVAGAVVTVDVDVVIQEHGDDGPWVDERLRDFARVEALQKAAPSTRPTLQLGALWGTLTWHEGTLENEQWGAIVRDPAAKTRRVHLRADVDAEALFAKLCQHVRDGWAPSVDIVVEGHDAAAVAAVDAALTAAFALNCVDRVPSKALTTELRPYLKDVTDADDVLVVNVDGDHLRAVLGCTAVRGIVDTANADSADLAAAVDDVVEGSLQHMHSCWCNDCCVYNDHVSLQVRGVSTAKLQKQLLQALQALKGLDGIELRKLEKDVARYDLSFDGGSETFAERIENAVVGSCVVEVIEVTRGHVILQLHPRSAAPPPRP